MLPAACKRSDKKTKNDAWKFVAYFRTISRPGLITPSAYRTSGLLVNQAQQFKLHQGG